jgi:anti-anti-sigma factor
MNYSMSKTDGAVVVTIHGSVWGELEDYQLKDEIKTQLDMGARGFVVDFADAKRLNSMGIGIVIASLVSVRDRGGRLVTCGMNRRVHTTFEVAGILQVLEVVPDRDAALAALAGDG